MTGSVAGWTGWREAWRDALGPAAPAGALFRVGGDLLTRWTEPHRHYHTVEHLVAVLAIVDRYADQVPDPGAVRLAAWFHDAVYDPHRVDNEDASALLAEEALPELAVPPRRVAEVARLVRLTASHDPRPGDRNGGLLSDADLAILAAPAPTYRAYAAAVRREYAHVPDPAFAAGRSAVLENLLTRDRLFHTPALRADLEDRARHNLAAELATLRSHPAAGDGVG